MHATLSEIALQIYLASIKDGRAVSFREAFKLAAEFIEEGEAWALDGDDTWKRGN